MQPAGAPRPVSTEMAGAKNSKSFRVLYLFSGARRQTSFANNLRREAKRHGFTVQVDEVDITFGQDHDLSVEQNRSEILKRLEDGFYDGVICTPPCSTYTRVRMANMRGPPPLRSKEFPSGFQWLSDKNKREADLGTLLVDFTLQVFQTVGRYPRSRQGVRVKTFSEHPEDLGAVCREEDGLWMTPASMWQKTEWQDIVSQQDTFTVAYNQCCWGADYRKPTRSVSNIADISQWGPNSWPTFDDNDIYLGPLQRCSCQAKYTLAKRSNREEFRTTGTSIYPEAMDRALAAALAKDWLNDATFSYSVGISKWHRHQR